jgi:hypothetical protein
LGAISDLGVWTGFPGVVVMDVSNVDEAPPPLFCEGDCLWLLEDDWDVLLIGDGMPQALPESWRLRAWDWLVAESRKPPSVECRGVCVSFPLGGR